MIDNTIISQIKLSTCAVIHMPVPHDQAGIALGDTFTMSDAPITNVVATGFLIQDDLVLTNRHVVENLHRDWQDLGHINHWYLRFGYPQGPERSELITRISKLFAFIDLAGGGSMDVGLLQFNRSNTSSGFAQCKPIEFGDLASIMPGNDIGICGFPLGNSLLTNAPQGIQRFGPVVHQGIISALSPFDEINPRFISTFLTDIHSAPGMSGAPVFTINDGKVIGLHYAGVEGTLGIAIPVDRQRVNGWIQFYQSTIEQGSIQGEVQLTRGGDITFK